MTDKEIIRHIDDGANHYVSLFGEAEHMDKVDKEYYSYVKPKAGEQGITFIYNIHIENLAPEQKKIVIDEMKSMNAPIWMSLLASDETVVLFSGKENAHGQAKRSEDDERYMAMLPEEKREYSESNYEMIKKEIIKIKTADEFALWARTANDIFFGGYPQIHPIHHYTWCEEKGVKCYVLYHDTTPVSVAAIMDNHGAASLEFVGTIPGMRQKGFARAVCEKAVYEAFLGGVSVITVRAVNAAAARLYQSVGFRVYD